jgi:hypothetical protein
MNLSGPFKSNKKEKDMKNPNCDQKENDWLWAIGSVMSRNYENKDTLSYIDWSVSILVPSMRRLR